MMSLFALTGLATYGFGGVVPDPIPADAADGDVHGELDVHGGDAGGAAPDLLADYAPNAAPDIYDFARGDMIAGFDPRYDVLELEYSRAMGTPEVTVINFADGTGASVALNGVVVADIEGAQGLDPALIMLRPV